mgnify:CR=1 FL=1
MINFLSTAENPDLRRAGNMLIIEGASFVTLAFAFSRLQMPAGESAALVGLLLFNLVPMCYLVRAARAQGKSAMSYGLISLIPAGAILAYFRLRSSERWS